MPCATQNEVDRSDVEALCKAGMTVRTKLLKSCPGNCSHLAGG